MDRQIRRYSHLHREQGTAVTDHPATITKLEDGALRMQEVGHDQVMEADEEQEDFFTYLRNDGGEWFWEDIQTPDGTEWLAEAMQNGTLTSVIDGSYMEHLHHNISGAGWIIQDRATGNIVQGTLTEWSTAAGSYRGELLGMLAVCMFLRAAEDY